MNLADRDAILADVIAAPEDDGIRRVAADWFEDSGDADWAELIRAQLDLAVISKDIHRLEASVFSDNPATARLRRSLEEKAVRWTERCREILADCDNVRRWAGNPFGGGMTKAVGDVTQHFDGGWPLDTSRYGPAESACPRPIVRFRFERGFVGYVDCIEEDWMEGGPARAGVGPLLAASYPLTTVHLIDREPSSDEPPPPRFRYWGCGGLFTYDTGKSHVLNYRLFARLRDGQMSNTLGPPFRVYAEHRDPQGDLSRAALDWARNPARVVEVKPPTAPLPPSPSAGPYPPTTGRTRYGAGRVFPPRRG